MHIHIIEPRPDGHRMQYVRRLIEQAPGDWEISLSSFPSAFKHPGTIAAAAVRPGQLRMLPIAGEAKFEQATQGVDGFKLQPEYWRLLRYHWRSISTAQRGDLVVLPYLDYISYAIGLLGSPFGNTPFSGVVMRPDFHWAEQGVLAPASKNARLKRWLFLRLLREPRLECLLTIDPSLRDWVTTRRPAGHRRMCYADDPADLAGSGTRSEARAFFGLRPDAPVILMFGSIDLRKGVASLLKLASQTQFPSDAQVLMVGRQSVEVRELMVQLSSGLPLGRVVVLDRYVSREEEWLAFTAADFGWVAYEDFYGPSGVVAQCRQMGLPMIHRGQGLIGYQLRDAPPISVDWLQSQGFDVAQMGATATASTGLQKVMFPCTDR
jgi:glycosyltransferase involved in cell wall biosynthesis